MADDTVDASPTLDPVTPDYTPAPSYLQAADNHSVASGSGSWISGVAESIGNAPKFWSLAVGSGVTGVLNTGIAVANWFNRDDDQIKSINYGKWIDDYDQDLGKYYKDNTDSIDTWGFVLSSLAPGLGGVKALNLTQAALRVAVTDGAIAGNMASATRLLIPSADRYITQAAGQIAAVNGRQALLTTGALKAVGSKLGQAVLESAAFESAAMATQFKNPYIDNMTGSDIAINAATNILLGGAIGGLIAAPGINRAINKQVINLDATGAAGIAQRGRFESSPMNLQATGHFLNREKIEDFIASAKQPPGPDDILPTGFTKEKADKNIANANEALDIINNHLRTSVQALTTNKEFGNYAADSIISAQSRAGANLMAGTDEIIRFGDRKLISAAGAKEPGQGSLDLKITGQRPGAVEDSSIQWAKLWDSDGPTNFGIFDDVPKAATLADSVKLSPGQTIKDGVNKVVDSFGHKIGGKNNTQIFDAMSTDVNLAEVQARYVKASRTNLTGPQDVIVTDLPHLDATYDQWDKVGKVTLKDAEGNVLNTINSKADLLQEIAKQKTDLVGQAIKTSGRRKVTGQSMEEIAARANVSPDFITSAGVNQDLSKNIFYMQSMAQKLGTTTEEMYYKPQWMGIKGSDISNLDQGMTNLHLDAEYRVRAEQQARQVSVDQAVEAAGARWGQSEFTNAATGTSTVANLTRQLPEAQEVLDGLSNANRYGSGSKLVKFANGNYGSFDSIMSNIGSIKNEMDSKASQMVMQRLDNSRKLLVNNSEVAAEYGVTKELVARSDAPLTILDGQIHYLDPAMRKTDPITGELIPAIKITNPGTAEVWMSHAEINGANISGYKTMRAATGLEDTRNPTQLYPIKPDPAKTPFFAFIVDNSLTGAQSGRVTMLHAASARDLELLTTKVKSQFPEWNIVTKSKSEDYHKALGDYTFDKSLHENHIDTAMKSKGIMSSPMPRTDGKYLADELTTWHLNQSRMYNSELIQSKYEMAFKELEDLAKTWGGFDSSKYSSMQAALSAGVKGNPYIEYARAALNISNISDHPLLTSISREMDNQVSNMYNRAVKIIRGMKGVDQTQLDMVNKIYADHGFKTSYPDAATYLYANHPAGTQVLSKFIRGAQSILATTFLRMDWLNAINNKLGSVVLTSSEFNYVLNGIRKQDPESVGKLSELGQFFTKVPGTEDSMLSAPKLIANSLRRLVADMAGPDAGLLTTKYSDLGYIKSLQSQQARDVMQNLTILGAESPSVLTGKLEKAFNAAKKLGDIGESVTLNKFMEHANRFMAADMMTQLTDIAVTKGIISPKEAGSYVRTFVNRTQVNLNAAQRPLIFQGPLGMATGLFQSYQFNLMQQLFRYMEPGNRKTAAFMMGLQGSIYGMSGLPGFQQLNSYVAQLNGNTEHLGISNLINKSAGYDTANLLLYGLPSNILRTNLWTRGDMTPQNPTILPSSLSEIPLVTMYGGFLKNLKNTAQNLYQGADLWPTFLSGLEHNSISRPLSGLAQTLRGLHNGTVYSTDGAGNILSSNDLFSLVTLGRLAGGKPLDEAIVRTEARRVNLIRQANTQQLVNASRALKLSLQDDGAVGQSQFDSVMDTFVQTGHKASGFNSWMMKQYMNANVSQAQKLRERLSDPYAQSLQRLMGGAEESGGLTFR